MRRALTYALAAASLAGMSAAALADEVGVGLKAPKLEAAKWFQGQPVQLADGKTINVIEFWATW
jgi:hypothetical protein